MQSIANPSADPLQVTTNKRDTQEMAMVHVHKFVESVTEPNNNNIANSAN